MRFNNFLISQCNVENCKFIRSAQERYISRLRGLDRTGADERDRGFTLEGEDESSLLADKSAQGLAIKSWLLCELVGPRAHNAYRCEDCSVGESNHAEGCWAHG